jgi:HSP20 family molecular chaperone IbpA
MNTPHTPTTPVQSETYFPTPPQVPVFWTDAHEDRLRLHVALPGCPRDQIQLELQDDCLLIQASRKSPIPTNASLRTLHRESSSARYQLRVQLPHRVHPEDVQTSRENGVLTLSIPQQVPRPQVIPVA